MIHLLNHISFSDIASLNNKSPQFCINLQTFSLKFSLITSDLCVAQAVEKVYTRGRNGL